MPILVFLHLKGLPAKTKVKDAHIELGHFLMSDAIAYSTVTKYTQNDVICKRARNPG
jgi:hypothetical protein